MYFNLSVKGGVVKMTVQMNSEEMPKKWYWIKKAIIVLGFILSAVIGAKVPEAKTVIDKIVNVIVSE